MSMDASGSLAGAMVFSRWKGRPLVRELVIPSNPRSAAQYATRAMMTFITQRWTPDGIFNIAGWNPLAQSDAISSFNAYTRFNMNRWTQFQAPRQQPGTSAAVLPVMGTMTAAGGVGQATLTVPVTTANSGWGAIIFAKLAVAPTGIKSEVRYVLSITGGSPYTAVITRLDPGTWHFKVMGFDVDGAKTSLGADVTAVVT